MSFEEVANGAGLRTDLPDELEAGADSSDDEAAKIKDVIAALGGVPGTEHLQHHEPEHHEASRAQRSPTSTVTTNHSLRKTPAREASFAII